MRSRRPPSPTRTAPRASSGGFQASLAATRAVGRLTAAFRTGEGLGRHEHHDDLFAGTERFSRPGYLANLTTSWIPALDGVEGKLRRGARVAEAAVLRPECGAVHFDSGLTAAMSGLHPKAVSQRPHEGVPQVDQYAIELRQARLWRAARRWTGILSVLAGLLAGAPLLFGGVALAAPVAAGATPAPAPATPSGPATAPPASSYTGGDRGFAARGADGSVYFSEGPGIGGSWTQMPGRR
jgi:hypothetical protein